MTIQYKVHDLVTGLYQDDKIIGTIHTDATWSNVGKLWHSLDELRSHFVVLQEKRILISPLWEIIELEGDNIKDRYPASALTR